MNEVNDTKLEQAYDDERERLGKMAKRVEKAFNVIADKYHIEHLNVTFILPISIESFAKHDLKYSFKRGRG